MFVIGLSPRLADPEVLKKNEYFGKYGRIYKVVINNHTVYNGAQVQEGGMGGGGRNGRNGRIYKVVINNHTVYNRAQVYLGGWEEEEVGGGRKRRGRKESTGGGKVREEGKYRRIYKVVINNHTVYNGAQVHLGGWEEGEGGRRRSREEG